MEVIFVNSKGNKIKIREVEDSDGAMKAIKDFCYERDFAIPYIRMWKSPENKNQTVVDCGSHYENFLIVED